MDFLDYKNMKVCTLVNSRWNNVVSNSKRFLNNSKLVLDLEEQEDEQQMSIMRNYRHIEIISQERYILDRKVLNQFAEYCKFLKSFALRHRGPINKRDFIEFILSCQQLEHLELRNCIRYKRVVSEDVYDAVEDAKIELPKLKSLINAESHWILKCLNCPRLKNFNYTGSESSDDYKDNLEETDKLFEFMNELKSVETLSLQRVILRRSQIELIPQFKWKNLSISEFDEDPDDFAMGNWKRLLTSSEKGSSIFINAWDDRFLAELLNEISNCGNTENIKIVENSTEFFHARFYDHLNPLFGVKKFEFEACAGDHYGFHRKLSTKLPEADDFSVSNISQNLPISYRIFSKS